MQEGTNYRFISTHNLSAKQNMAIDKTLIHSFNTHKEPIFRLYTWKKSFTVGISQDCESYNALYPDFKGNCAKRMTGGGVLFHGHDVSYCVIVPTEHLEGLNVKQSYEKICSFLLAFYKNLALEASYAKDIESITLSKSPFCQVGFEAYDIIVNGVKIGGNAQKRAKHFIFQHGSIPIESIEKNNMKKEELGQSLKDIQVHLSFDEAIEKLAKAFESTFDIHLIPSSLNEEEKTYMKKILEVQ